MDKKYCSYCSIFRPVEEITFEWRGRGSRQTKKIICVSCKEGRDGNKSVAQRDAFGKRASEANKAQQSVVSRLYTQKQ